MIEFISATRATETEFWTRTALGVSLQRLGRNGKHDASIAFGNRRGLPDVYNARIEAAEADRMLVFVHDDVWLPDFFLHEHLSAALDAFDVVGVAGCTTSIAGTGWRWAKGWACPTRRGSSPKRSRGPPPRSSGSRRGFPRTFPPPCRRRSMPG